MSLRTVLLFFPLLVAWSGEASAGDPDDFSRITSSLGTGVSTPLNPTKQVVGAGANIVVGAGYNLDRHNSIIGQFMWSALRPDKDVLRPIWIAAGSRDISGRSNLFAFTADYRFNLEGKRFGAYVIGGGGLYYRHASLSQEVTTGVGTICTPSWTYWGYSCASGIVTNDETLISTGSTAFGGNAGAGFTIRITEDGYKFFVEGRYHYAPTKNFATKIIPITLGISW